MANQVPTPLLCDLETGLCQLPALSTADTAPSLTVDTKPLKIIYYTDPICSTCWGIEAPLRKLKLEYGQYLSIDYRMGGLLPDWSYNSGGISQPSDVAAHWDEVSQQYDMPIDGDVWLTDPLPSSYPPSIAVKAAQLQDTAQAVRFLRVLREMVFLQKKNITRWEHLTAAAQAVGLDTDRLKTDYQQQAKALFDADLELGRKLGVRGFPTLFFVNAAGRQEVVYGAKPYSVYEQTVRQLYPEAARKQVDTSWQNLIATYPTLTAREFSELANVPRPESEAFLQSLVREGYLTQLTTKNGSLWTCRPAGGQA